MIDIFIQIYNGLKTAVNNYNSDAKVYNAYVPSTASFPYISIEEKSNVEIANKRELDSAETMSRVMYEINIYDNTTNKIQVCRGLASVVNDYMSVLAGLKRTSNQPIPNTANTQIYRVVQRFEGYINNDTGVIYKEI